MRRRAFLLLALGYVVVLGCFLVMRRSRVVPQTSPGMEEAAEKSVVRKVTEKEAEAEAAGTPVLKKPAKDLAKVISEALAKISTTKQIEVQEAQITELIRELFANGAPGIEQIGAFLNNGSDIELRDGFAQKNGRITSWPTLRVALLDALTDWKGPETPRICREVLAAAQRPLELAIASRILETTVPGTYRNEIVGTMEKLAVPAGQAFDDEAPQFVIQALDHFKAPELAAIGERLLPDNPALTFQFVEALNGFPREMELTILRRLLPKVNVTSEGPGGLSIVEILDYREPPMRSIMRRVFAGLEKTERAEFLMEIADYAPLVDFDYLMDRAASDPAPTDREQIEGRLQLLELISAACKLSDLLPELAAAQKTLRTMAADPALPARTNSEFGDGTGKIISDGAKIEAIEIRR